MITPSLFMHRLEAMKLPLQDFIYICEYVTKLQGDHAASSSHICILEGRLKRAKRELENMKRLREHGAAHPSVFNAIKYLKDSRDHLDKMIQEWEGTPEC